MFRVKRLPPTSTEVFTNFVTAFAPFAPPCTQGGTVQGSLCTKTLEWSPVSGGLYVR